MLGRPKLVEKYDVQWGEVTRFVGDLVAGASIHEVNDPPRRCRDPMDDVLLALAARIAPSVLVTGGRDLFDDGPLVESMKVAEVDILTPALFRLRIAAP